MNLSAVTRTRRHGIVGLLLVALSPVVAVTLAAEEVSPIAFSWALGVLRDPEGAKQLEAITEDTKLATGDAVKMLVDIREPCFVYVVEVDAEGGVRLRFPYSLSSMTETAEPTGTAQPIPRDGWLRVEGSGQLTIYLLASVERLTDLEELIESYGQDDANTRQIADEIMDHILELRRKHWRSSKVTERPAALAGNIRGSEVPKSLAHLATEFRATGMFSRTFVLTY